MYFLWKRTPHGSIRVSSGGLSGFVNRVLSGKSRCCSLSLAEGESASVTLVLSSDSSADSSRVEERIASIVSPMGFCVQCIWVEKNVPGMELRDALDFMCRSPWAWMFIAGVIAMGIMSGLNALFWTFFWGTAAWFTSKGIISFLTKRKKIDFVLPSLKR